jgi:XPG N-terminal domain
VRARQRTSAASCRMQPLYRNVAAAVKGLKQRTMLYLMQGYCGRYVAFCMDRVRLLRGCGVVPVMVFDGGRLPMKASEEESRAK